MPPSKSHIRRTGASEKTINHESFTSYLYPCKDLARRISHILANGGITELHIWKYRVTSNNTFAKVTPTDLITPIRFSVSDLKLHHAGINPDQVNVNYIVSGGGMYLKLHRASDTTIIKMFWWSSLTFLMYIHNQIGYISK